MAGGKELEQSDLIIQGLIMTDDWDGVRRFLASRAKQHPELYPDDSPENFERLKRERAKQLLLYGYLLDDFYKEDAPGGNRRISYNLAKRETRKRNFQMIMGEWGEVHTHTAWVRVDIPKEQLTFLEEPIGPLQDPDEFLVVFTGIWLAKDLKSRITLPSRDFEEELLTASAAHTGFSFGRIEDKQGRSTIVLTQNLNKIRGVLHRSLLVQAIPHIDELLPYNNLKNQVRFLPKE